LIDTLPKVLWTQLQAKFSIVDAFNPMQTLVGLRVGFHNAASNRFLKLHGTAAASPTCDAGAMPDGWQAKRGMILCTSEP